MGTSSRTCRFAFTVGTVLGFVCGLPAGASAQPSFRGVRSHLVDPSPDIHPVIARLADVNEDGFPDVVATRHCAPCTEVNVSVGDGRGGFLLASSLTLNQGVARLEPIDVNEDGHLDLIALGRSERTFTIVPGDGTGVFAISNSSTIPLADFGHELAAADFDHDGHIDFVVASRNLLSLFLLLGDGTGAFRPAAWSGGGFVARSLVVADLDRDGNLDLIMATACGVLCSHEGIAWMLGDGQGGFGPPVFRESAAPSDLVALDFDADGDVDLAVANPSTVPVSVYLMRNDGGGVLTFAGFIPSGPGSDALVSADFDSDGHADLAAVGRRLYDDQTRQVEVLLGDGAGTFTPSAAFAVPSGFDLVAADVDADGSIDLAAPFVGTLAVHRGFGDGRFEATARAPAGGRPYYKAFAADFDEDGRSDLAIALNTPSGPRLSVLLGAAAGGFGAPDVMMPFPYGSLDLNEDGHVDLLTYDSYDGVRAFLGDGSGRFTVGPSVPAGPFGSPEAMTDVNEDGHVDVVTAGIEVVRVFAGRGDGTLDGPIESPTFSDAGEYVVGDFDEDGHLDFIASTLPSFQTRPSRVSLFLGRGDGRFEPTGTTLLTQVGWRAGIAADFDGDGHQDVAYGQGASPRDPSAAGITLVLGNGDGTLQAPRVLRHGFRGNAVAAGDFDLDGLDDLAVALEGQDAVLAFRGHRTEGLVEGFVYRTGSHPQAIAAGDFDGDGDVDLVTANSDILDERAGTNDVSLLLNDTAIPFLDCRTGNVNVAAGAITDVLFVNGSAGSGRARRVVVSPFGPLQIRVDGPASNPNGPASFVVWCWREAPTPSTVTRMPFRLGNIGMPTPLTRERVPQPVFIANNVGIPQRLGVENWPTGRTSPAPTVLLNRPTGVRRSGTFYFQGSIFDSAGPNNLSALTNGIEVVIR